jgi:hypothetical protein
LSKLWGEDYERGRKRGGRHSMRGSGAVVAVGVGLERIEVVVIHVWANQKEIDGRQTNGLVDTRFVHNLKKRLTTQSFRVFIRSEMQRVRSNE